MAINMIFRYEMAKEGQTLSQVNPKPTLIPRGSKG